MTKIDAARAALADMRENGLEKPTVRAMVQALLPEIEGLLEQGYSLSAIHADLERRGVKVGSYQNFHAHLKKAREARA